MFFQCKTKIMQISDTACKKENNTSTCLKEPAYTSLWGAYTYIFFCAKM